MGFDITGLGSIFDFGSKIIDKIFPDKDAADRAKIDLLKAQQEGAFKELELQVQTQIEQIKVNAIEAGSSDPYTSRWRPTVGYICCLALGWNFIVHPMLVWGITFWKPGMVPPPLLENGLMELVLGMLGIGGMRTWEKIKGVSK